MTAELPPESDEWPVRQDSSPEPEVGLPDGFDIDDTIRASKTGKLPDGSQLIISFEAFIDWRSGTKVGIQLRSRAIRTNPGSKVYPLFTTFQLTLLTKKIGNTKLMEVTPTEFEWPTYGLRLVRVSPKQAVYAPATAFSDRNNSVMLPFMGDHLIEGTGPSRDNKIVKVSVFARGGLITGQQFQSPTKSAIRGGA